MPRKPKRSYAELEREVRSLKRTLSEVHEQQTATAEILRIISGSPTDTQPVFDAIAQTALRLFHGHHSAVILVNGDRMERPAYTGGAKQKKAQEFYPMPLDRSTLAGRAIVDRKLVHVRDIRTEADLPERGRAFAEEVGFRAAMIAPMMRENSVIGAVAVSRASPGGFTDNEIALLKTFTAQAVIAVENVRLFQELQTKNADLTEALEQQTATSEILNVISHSTLDVAPVFQSVVEKAVKLCGADNASILQREGDLYRYVANAGNFADQTAFMSFWGTITLRPGRGSLTGRVALERRSVQIEDVDTDPEYERDYAAHKVSGSKAHLGVPLLKGGEPVGLIIARRFAPQLFTGKQIKILETFAAQAVIAVENVRLFKELQAKNADLTEALEQQTATSEILRVISGSPTDLQPVFDTIVRSATRLCSASRGALRLYDGQAFTEMVAEQGAPTAYSEWRRRHGRLRPDPLSAAGQVIAEKRVIHIADLAETPAYINRDPLTVASVELGGTRTILIVPMLKEGTLIGAIVIHRQEVRPFTDKQIALLKTFADQAVIAIENVRLFKELQARNAEVTEALEQQTVTADILKVISRSPTDTQPVFDAIVKSGVHLFGGMNMSLRLVKGEHTEPVASTIPLRDADKYPVPLSDDGSPSTQAIRRREVVQIPDLFVEEWVSEQVRQRAERRGFRAIVSAPMLRENTAIGVINVLRAAPGPFTDKQIALLKTFADQAVIAIENVRLFKELQARNAELSESLEQQTATSEILRIISSSPTDTQPVFDAIVKSGVRLFGGLNMSLRLVKGDQTEVVATTDHARDGVYLPTPLNDDRRPSARAILRREVVQMPDIFAEGVSEVTRARAVRSGNRAALYAPMLRGNNAIGVISVSRVTAGAFTDKEVALVKTFADQAVIAIENVRLFRELQARNADLTEALEQQTATSEILGAISRSPTDVMPVFETLMKNAAKLCGSPMAAIFRFDGDLVHLAATDNWPPEALTELDRCFPTPPNPALISGRVILSRSVVRESDALSDPNYDHALAMKGKWRRVLGVPLLRDGEPIGAINLAWPDPGETPEGQVALLKTFADQAVIAIENVRLFKELQARNAEITEALEQQTATGEILRVISQSPTDVQPVFDTIAESAARLCESLNGVIFRRDGDRLVLVAHRGPNPPGPIGEFTLPLDRGNVPGRSIIDGQMVHVADLQAESGEFPEGSEVARRTGFRTALAVPLMRDGVAIGAIGVRRAEAHLFSDRQVELLKTFADQAVIAIENVRLFKELQAKNADLTEALEQQTATSEILRVISSSPTDLQPVFDAILEKATRLCDAHLASLGLYDGEKYQHVAQRGGNPAYVKYLLRDPFDPASAPTIGRMIAERQAIHIPDVMETPYYRAEVPAPVAMVELGGGRTVLAVPMLKEGRMVGGIFIYRPEVRPFTQKQIDLVSTFASQAVIAIENVRLFKEINEALQQQTSIAEILRVISSTPTDVMPVLDAVTHRAAQLCDAPDARLFLVEGDTLRYVAGFGELKGARPTLPLTRGLVTGRAILDRSVVHIEDLAATLDEFPEARGPQREFGSRTTLAVPLVRENRAFGGIVMRRKEVRPFTAKQIELVKTFADQATIAIENVRLFNEIQDKSQQLEIANKHKSEFLANMSHELRTPLNAINGFSEMLLARMFGELNAKQEEFLRDIHSSGEHLLSLINDILDLSKIEAGRMELNLTVFDLAVTLENTVTLVKERAARRGITVNLDVDKRLDKWVADERKFRQIMLNLLSNALKFTPEGGQIGVLAAQDGSNMVVAVTDTGVGIRPEDQALIFEEFQQAGSDYTKKAEGTGLGLALTRKFVELHGGTIRVESVEGKGSTFTFTLPERQG